MQLEPKYLGDKCWRVLVQPFKWIAQAWQDLPLSIKGVCVIALPLAILLFSLSFLYTREQEVTQLENKLQIALQNQRDIQTVHTQLLEASTGVRDYLLTGDKNFLSNFYQAERLLPSLLIQLQKQLESEHQKKRLKQITPLVTQNLHDLKMLSENESDIASDTLIAKFRSQVSTLNRLRKEIENLHAEEAALVAQDQQNVSKKRQRHIAITLIAAVSGIAGSLIGVWLFSGTIVKRVRLLRDSAAHLAKAESLDLPSSSRDELGQLSNELDQASQLLSKNINDALAARHEAEEASASKSRFLSRTSHELRTPLNAILGFAQLLEDDLPQGKQRDSVSLIKGAGQHLLKLINEVLEITRVESGEISLPLTPVNITDILQEAQHYIAPLGRLRDIQIDCQYEDNIWAQANRQKLLQVILNLLSNALKYGPDSATVYLKAYRKQNYIVIEVLDEGAGIPETMRNRLFTPFDRLGAEQTKVEGTGLGLALSKQLMLAMQGSIHVDDKKSLFWLEIPAVHAHAEQTSVQLQEKLGSVNRHTHKEKQSVLYVEDNASNRALVEAILQRHTHLRLQCVQTIKDALHTLAQMRPSVLIIDLNLPDGSGEDLINQLKKDERYASIPIMVLTADALQSTAERLGALGIACYLTKPLDVAVFTKTIKSLTSE